MTDLYQEFEVTSVVGGIKRFCQITEWILFTSIPVLAAIRSANPDKYADPARALIKFVSDWPLSFVIWIATAGLLFKILNELVFPKYINNREEIKKVLDSLHEEYFREIPKEEFFKHRVTLMKSRKHFFTREYRYLKVFERSGTAYLRSRTYLYINDNHENINEGIAGRAWFTNAKCTVKDLPAYVST